ncbi:DNA polymerase III subunit delta [Tumidithrix helvetica PCC 7403]|uniref:DNA polymerase III subunit delta n=1 Tax=Tumidithrix helvetica TaxID=3457545 RepID=UPI003CBC875C
MPTYFYWGDDEYQIIQATQKLQNSSIDLMWRDFNFVKTTAVSDRQIIEGLNQAATPPFGMGNRLTWLADTSITQQCSEIVLAELERTLAHLPSESYLLFTAPNKPDGRLKSTKLLQKFATIQEFSLIPVWKTESIAQLVKSFAADIGLQLTSDGIDLLVDSIGSDSRRLVMELQKLQLWHHGQTKPLDAKAIAALVPKNAHNSVQLANAIRLGNVSMSLSLLAELLRNNEAGLRICATLTGQFRTWLWVKLMQESGERDDKAIADAADLGNPKRVYFLKQEVLRLTSQKLMQALATLLRLEFGLKRGMDEMATLQTAVIELCSFMV